MAENQTQGGYSLTIDDIIKVFCSVDDFCNIFQSFFNQKLLEVGARARDRKRSMALSEIMTILILFHMSYFRDFKHFYFSLKMDHSKEFPGLPSYQRFVEWIPSVLIPLIAYLKSRKGTCTGIQCVDSTAVAVCHNKRISRHKVFEGLAQRGKTSMGWFFGFKLHLIVNDLGELLAFQFTPGNTDDRNVLLSLAKGLTGKLFGDKGYLSAKKIAQLLQQGLHLITGIRSNMKNKLLPLWDKLLLRKRFIIETIIDQLKNISQIEHSRHRSVYNFFVNLLCGLIAYTFREKKPCIYDPAGDNNLLPVFL